MGNCLLWALPGGLLRERLAAAHPRIRKDTSGNRRIPVPAPVAACTLVSKTRLLQAASVVPGPTVRTIAVLPPRESGAFVAPSAVGELSTESPTAVPIAVPAKLDWFPSRRVAVGIPGRLAPGDARREPVGRSPASMRAAPREWHFRANSALMATACKPTARSARATQRGVCGFRARVAVTVSSCRLPRRSCRLMRRRRARQGIGPQGKPGISARCRNRSRQSARNESAS